MVDSCLESDYVRSCEYNGLGAHSYALSRMGEEVQEWRVVPFAGLPFQRFLWSAFLKGERENPELKEKRLSHGFAQVLKKLESTSFDILFTREAWDYPLDFLDEIKKRIPIRVTWLSSSPGRAPFPSIWDHLKFFTHIFLIDRKGVEVLRERGFNAFYLPFAMADFPQVRIKRSKSSRIGFLGTLYPDRMGLLKLLSEFDFSFWAPNFSAGTSIMYPELKRFFRGEVWGRDLLQNMARLELLINPIHRAYMRGQEDNVTNFRLFEAIGVETFQIAEHKPAIREIFSKEEVETYQSREELRDKIAFYLAHPDTREKMVQTALEKVLDNHLYSHRMEEILKIIQE